MMVTNPTAALVDVPLGKYRLLEAVDEAYGELRRELARVRRVAGASGRRSLGDHLGHLAAWEAVELARVEGRTGASEALALLWSRARRAAGLHERAEVALARFEDLHARLMLALWDLPEAALRRPWNRGFPTTLAAELERNVRRHYAEHLAEISGLA
jgi:DinB superfamily